MARTVTVPSIQTLPPGTLALTATRRLARWLRRQHNEAQRAAGLTAWDSPRVASIDDWLAECWDALLDRFRPGDAPPLLLSDAQAGAVWERLLLEDPAAERVLHPRAAAALAQEAWSLAHDWRLPVISERGESPDVAAWLRWSEAFRRLCAERGWVDQPRLAGTIADALRTGTLEAPGPVLLFGFDELTPSKAALLEALRSRGCTITERPPPVLAGTARVSAWADAEAEAEAAARWARHWLEAGDAGPIGIVVPNLTDRRAQIERHLREVLVPSALRPGARPELPYTMLPGPRLDTVPMVRTALALLRLWRERLTLDDVGHLLKTPFCAGSEGERSRRGLLEARLRDLGELEPTVGTLQRLASPAATEDVRPSHCPRLSAALGAALALKAGHPAKQPCAAWARAFDEWLAALGWPGERPLDTVEHQAREAWQKLVENLARLECVLPPMTWPEALERLTRLAGTSTFQPQTPFTPVQVLSLRESNGLAFQHLWVMGMDDETWPPAPRPNPFLPLALQRRLGLPGASAARELERARRETARLRDAAPDVVFSHAQLSGDAERRPSPLLAGLPVAAPGTVPCSEVTRPAEALRESVLHPWRDDRAPPLPAPAEVPGGTAVFRDMAACPFRAFALHRLHAETLAEPVPGLAADRRGQLAHRALELLWLKLANSAALAALAPESARTLADETAQTAIGDCEGRWGRRLAPAVVGLERRRIAGLLLELLELERARAPFRVVAKEERRAVTLGGLTLRVQVDRVDELPDGRRLLLDYKTGRVSSVEGWFSERPEDPQLPIYAVTSPQPVHALGFVRVRHGDVGYVGMTEGIELPRRAPAASGRAPRPQPDFAGYVDEAAGHEFKDRAEVLAAWQATLERLGTEFRAGSAAVDPKDSAKTCLYCLLPALCRIEPQRQVVGEEPEPGGADGDA